MSHLLQLNDRENLSLAKALAELHANQPAKEPKRTLRPRSDVPKSNFSYVYWDETKGKWGVFVHFKGKRYWCGSTYYQERAPDMQARKIEELKAKK